MMGEGLGELRRRHWGPLLLLVAAIYSFGMVVAQVHGLGFGLDLGLGAAPVAGPGPDGSLARQQDQDLPVQI